MCSTLSPRLSVWIDDDGKGFLYHSLGLMDFKEKAIKCSEPKLPAAYPMKHNVNCSNRMIIMTTTMYAAAQ